MAFEVHRASIEGFILLLGRDVDLFTQEYLGREFYIFRDATVGPHTVGLRARAPNGAVHAGYIERTPDNAPRLRFTVPVRVTSAQGVLALPPMPVVTAEAFSAADVVSPMDADRLAALRSAEEENTRLRAALEGVVDLHTLQQEVLRGLYRTGLRFTWGVDWQRLLVHLAVAVGNACTGVVSYQENPSDGNRETMTQRLIDVLLVLFALASVVGVNFRGVRMRWTEIQASAPALRGASQGQS